LTNPIKACPGRGVTEAQSGGTTYTTQVTLVVQ
jgi:hypothetical protein